jgi:hypothetical protein
MSAAQIAYRQGRNRRDFGAGKSEFPTGFPPASAILLRINVRAKVTPSTGQNLVKNFLTLCGTGLQNWNRGFPEMQLSTSARLQTAPVFQVFHHVTFAP